MCVCNKYPISCVKHYYYHAITTESFLQKRLAYFYRFHVFQVEKDTFLVCSNDSVFKYLKKKKANTEEKATQEVDGTLNENHSGMSESYTQKKDIILYFVYVLWFWYSLNLSKYFIFLLSF